MANHYPREFTSAYVTAVGRDALCAPFFRRLLHRSTRTSDNLERMLRYGLIGVS